VVRETRYYVYEGHLDEECTDPIPEIRGR